MNHLKKFRNVFFLLLGYFFFTCSNVFGNSVASLVQEYMDRQEYLTRTPLCDIMSKYGSDKGSAHHNYASLYHKLFSRIRGVTFTVFELGIGTNYTDVPSSMGIHGKPGASLYGWREYFPYANVYAADIDSRILFNSQRIKTYYCDQRSPESVRELFSGNELSNIEFDIIIDDGLHAFNANYNLLVNSIGKLKRGGIYIVEDLQTDTRDAFNGILQSIKEAYNLSYIAILEIPNPTNQSDNRLLIIQK